MKYIINKTFPNVFSSDGKRKKITECDQRHEYE